MRLNIDGIQYNIEIRGKGKPLLCIHGFSESADTWKALDIAGHRLYMVDLIGHGKSMRPTEKKYYKIRCILDHLHKIIHQLGLETYKILGYSMGGRIALAYAIKYPEEIEALIIESGSYNEEGVWNRLARRRGDRKLAKKIVVNGMKWFDEYWSNLPIFITQEKLPESLKAEISRRRQGNTDYALANTLLSTGQGTLPCLKRYLNKLDIPILYICGEYDLRYRQIGTMFTAHNNTIACRVINKAGHNTHLEKPTIFCNEVNNFIIKEK